MRPVNPAGMTGVEAGGVWASAVAALFATFFRPLTKTGRERRKQDKLMRLWFNGASGVEGVSPTLVPAPVQLANVQRDVGEILSTVGQILNIVSPPEAR